jgi:hypothetical protein
MAQEIQEIAIGLKVNVPEQKALGEWVNPP